MTIDVFSDNKITLAEVADVLGVDLQTVSKWRRNGMRCVRIGRHWVTTREHVNAYVNSAQPNSETQKTTERINDLLKI